MLSSANDMAMKLNGKNSAEARLHAAAIAAVLDESLTELVKQAQYQSQALHSISEQLQVLVEASKSP